MVRLREDLRLRSYLVLFQLPLRFVLVVKHRLLHLPTLTDTNWKVCSERHFAQAFYFALQWTLNLASDFSGVEEPGDWQDYRKLVRRSLVKKGCASRVRLVGLTD